VLDKSRTIRKVLMYSRVVESVAAVRGRHLMKTRILEFPERVEE
jgi:hypothetical protein